MTELCKTFRREAATVWNRTRQAARLGISLSEETLTEWAMYQIAASHQHQGIVVDLATKPAESKHGADWEWWLARGGKAVCFRVQAKRLYPDGRYRALRKPGPHPYEQLDKLVSSAQQAGAYPLYCFYNFQFPKISFGSPNHCQHSYRAPSYWGCSLAFPDQVKSLNSDALKSLRPHMFPWHQLVCSHGNLDLPKSGIEFVRRSRGGTLPGLRALSPQAARLIEFGNQNRKNDLRDQLDPSFWQEGGESFASVAGIAVFRELQE